MCLFILVNKRIFCLCLTFVSIFTKQLVSSQTIYENIREFHGTFTKNTKTTTCSESVEACANRLNRCDIKNQALENDVLEYKSKFEKIRFRPKRVLKRTTVNDMCTSMPNLRFEHPELCPFFYDCSHSESFLQQCQYPLLYSDTNLRCEDPSVVDCGKRNITYGYRCDFETTTEARCFLSNSNSGDFNWTRRIGSTPSSNTGPSSAYSGSYYKYIEASDPRVSGDTAVLVSDKRFQEKTYCLSLRYHMRGSHIGSLKIKTKNVFNSSTLVTQITGNQGSSWYKLTGQNIRLNAYTKILIEATRGAGFRGDIAIDHVTLWPMKCP